MIRVDHLGVPARDKQAAAGLLASIFATAATARGGPFIAVPVANEFTLDVFDADPVGQMHLAFVADPAEFEAIVGRLQAAGIAYGSQPDDPTNGQLEHPLASRGLYFRTPDGHLLEVMSEPVAATSP